MSDQDAAIRVYYMAEGLRLESVYDDLDDALGFVKTVMETDETAVVMLARVKEINHGKNYFKLRLGNPSDSD
jgi:hypothetical protein